MLRRLLPLTLFALLLLPAAAMAAEEAGSKEYVTELFIGLIVLVIAIGWPARPEDAVDWVRRCVTCVLVR